MEQRFTFSKQEKLTGETTVNELFLTGNSFLAYPIRIVWSADQTAEPAFLKVLVSVPKKKLKHAVDRNRVKRLLRETFRLQNYALKLLVAQQGLHVKMAIVWIPNEVLDYAKVERKMSEALVKMQKLLLSTTEKRND